MPWLKLDKPVLTLGLNDHASAAQTLAHTSSDAACRSIEARPTPRSPTPQGIDNADVADLASVQLLDLVRKNPKILQEA